jgi:HK97 family phage major capsid protein
MPMTVKAWNLLEQVHEIRECADAENRELTPQERERAEGLIARAKEAQGLERKMRELDGDVTWQHGESAAGKGPGDQFIESKGYKAVQDPGSRGQTFATGPIQVADGPLSAKGTVLTSPGSALTPAQYEPGIVSTLFQPLGVADLFGTSTTSASQVRYVNETTATNAAAGVAEAATKPESTLAFGEVTEPIKKLATTLSVSDELFSDAPSIQTYLNSRLSLFVKIEEERQLLRGAGTNELVGMFGAARNVGTYARGTVDNNAVAILRAAHGVRGSSFLEPDGIIMHPTNWLTTRLLTDTAGQFLGGGPFQGQYGNGSQVPTSPYTAAALWGMPVVVSTVVGAGTALLGSFRQGAHLWRRSGVSVEASNSHGSYFVQDLVALRAEERLGLGVFRSSAFVQVTDLS